MRLLLPADASEPLYHPGMFFEDLEKVGSDPCSASAGEFRWQQMPVFVQVFLGGCQLLIR